jgi:predicted DNA-binding transcriptional regulator AlpA
MWRRLAVQAKHVLQLAAEALANRPEDAKPTKTAAAVEPLLVGADKAAAMCGISPASWFRLKASGQTPAPVRLNRSVRYRVEDLRLWIELGCPDLNTFEARKTVINGR